MLSESVGPHTQDLYCSCSMRRSARTLWATDAVKQTGVLTHQQEVSIDLQCLGLRSSGCALLAIGADLGLACTLDLSVHFVP